MGGSGRPADLKGGLTMDEIRDLCRNALLAGGCLALTPGCPGPCDDPPRYVTASTHNSYGVSSNDLIAMCGVERTGTVYWTSSNTTTPFQSTLAYAGPTTKLECDGTLKVPSTLSMQTQDGALDASFAIVLDCPYCTQTQGGAWFEAEPLPATQVRGTLVSDWPATSMLELPQGVFEPFYHYNEGGVFCRRDANGQLQGVGEFKFDPLPAAGDR